MSSNDCIARFMSRWIRAGSCVMDVGANQGLYLEFLVELVGETGSLHSFEPNPELARQLRRRAAGHAVVVNEMGVSDRQGTAEFFLDERAALGAVASSLEKLHGMHGTENVRPIPIQLTTLDSYCAAQQLSPDFIKIDVEGHELSVFRGAIETIARCRPFFVFEFWESWWEPRVRQIFDFLKQHYVLVRLQDGLVVNDWYDSNASQGTVDIGCIPIMRSQGEEMRPALLELES